VLIENLQNEVTTPEHILEILNIGHFDNVGVTLDVGHAHLSDSGMDHAFELLKPRIRELHLHDNNRLRDEHLWPGSGSIDWTNLQKLAATLPAEIPGILEIAHDLNETADSATTKATAAFDQQLRLAEELGA
jgi:sugar phosphate isomerase/epimerase